MIIYFHKHLNSCTNITPVNSKELYIGNFYELFLKNENKKTRIHFNHLKLVSW